MKKKYSTDELVKGLEIEKKGDYQRWVDVDELDAIIARLRAADKLCEAAKKLRRRPWVIELRRAIAEYEGKEKK